MKTLLSIFFFTLFLVGDAELDLGFIMGSYGSNAAGVFNLEKDFASQYIQTLPYCKDKINIGFITYGKSANVEHKFGEITTIASALQTLEFNIRNPNNGNNVTIALQTARKKLFKEATNSNTYGTRRNALKSLVVFIDQPLLDDVTKEVSLLQDAGVQVIFVALKDKIDKEMLIKKIGREVSVLFIKDGKVSTDDVKEAVDKISSGEFWQGELNFIKSIVKL